MLITLNGRMKEEDFEKINQSSGNPVELDCVNIKYFTSKEISRLLIFSTKHKKTIILKNANPHIKDTIHLLKLEHLFQLDE